MRKSPAMVAPQRGDFALTVRLDKIAPCFVRHFRLDGSARLRRPAFVVFDFSERVEREAFVRAI